MKFTKDEVVKLFEQVKLSPKTSCVLDRLDDGKLCGCLIGALYLKEHKNARIPKNITYKFIDKIYKWAENKFEYQNMWNMIRAFDYQRVSGKYRGIAAASKALNAKGN